MQRHYNMYYGGEYLEPNKINLKIGKGKMLPPVSAEVVAYTEASEIDKPMSEIDKDASKFDKEVSKIDKDVSKIDPYNNIKNIKKQQQQTQCVC